MLDVSLLLKGIVLGISIAAPVGPIGLLCIRRTLTQGTRVGFVSGLGAATADALYGSVAAAGMGAVAIFLVGMQFWLRLVGGCFLVFLGVRTFFSRVAEKPAPVSGSGLVESFASTFFLTLTNPMTILAFASILAAFNLSQTRFLGSAIPLVLGVFCGSALWWLALSAGAGRLRTRITPARLTWVNRVSGALIVGFGVLAFASLAGLTGG